MGVIDAEIRLMMHHVCIIKYNSNHHSPIAKQHLYFTINFKHSKIHLFSV